MAESREEILKCQSLISQIYFKQFGIRFSSTQPNPSNKIELLPHYYLMGIYNGELIATMGLYLHSTDLERYANVTAQDIEQILLEAQAIDRYSGENFRELTKFVIKEQWQGKGIGKLLMGVAHSQDFIHFDGKHENLVVSCGNASIFHNFPDYLNIKTRFIKYVPYNKLFKFYVSKTEPMECRLSIPDLDIPEEWYRFKIPGEMKL
ncbi:hypothetical protein [Moorena sp. SIO4G3]|uniref:hypothetical protein n=1 Tax=Moorena sp. SIO4G3 TaxID=2607821 RepID=UPI00142C7FDC|nr:hypothetical protein [Moorena sp. SIO4G3]NEO80017.1 hypothetical protein [Moorena sp. SIO4G3]